MLSSFQRLSKLVDYLNIESNQNDKSFLYAKIRDVCERTFTLDYRQYQDFRVDPIKKYLIHTGRDYNFFAEEYSDEMIKEYSLSEDNCNKLWVVLQKLAMEMVETEYQEKEKREREIEKKTYLNTKLFGQSIDFIMED